MGVSRVSAKINKEGTGTRARMSCALFVVFCVLCLVSCVLCLGSRKEEEGAKERAGEEENSGTRIVSHVRPAFGESSRELSPRS